jgi:hypothetical protein
MQSPRVGVLQVIKLRFSGTLPVETQQKPGVDVWIELDECGGAVPPRWVDYRPGARAAKLLQFQDRFWSIRLILRNLYRLRGVVPGEAVSLGRAEHQAEREQQVGSGSTHGKSHIARSVTTPARTTMIRLTGSLRAKATGSPRMRPR